MCEISGQDEKFLKALPLPSIVRDCDPSNCYWLAPDEETQTAQGDEGSEDHHGPQDPYATQVEPTDQPSTKYRSTSSARNSDNTLSVKIGRLSVTDLHSKIVNVPLGPIFIIFMQCPAKFREIIDWRSSPSGKC